MTANEQSLNKIARALRKTAEKLPTQADDPALTDLYLQVSQESGELRVLDDNDQELTRCVIEEWIGNTDEDFYTHVQATLRSVLHAQQALIEGINLLRPYSFVLIDEEHETIAELHLVDDDTIILHHELMAGLSDDLEAFWQELSAK
ncbi:MAG: hypothetical protein Q4D66_03585 [Bacteroidales bacterium]|nr:hypothetical protein [Bacteroidales bacterium]